VVLRWKAVSGATLYDLQIASDSEFKDVVLSVRIATNGYRWEATPERPHFFRARGLDGENRAGPWSESKEIAAVFVAPPLLKPPRGSSVSLDPNGNKIDFEFDTSPLFTSYRLEVATDEKFTAIVFEQTEPVAPISFVTKSAGTYYYRLTAQAEGGKQTAPGTVGSFTIQLSGPETLGAESIDARVGEDVELTWRACKGCVGYRVQIGTEPKWKTLVLDERMKLTHFTYQPSTVGHLSWRVFGEDAAGKRSLPSGVKAIMVTDAASEPTAKEKPSPPPRPPSPPPASAPVAVLEDSSTHFFYGVGHALHWNFGATVSPLARAEGGMSLPLGPGRFLLFLTGGVEHMDPSAEFPGANVRPDLLVFPLTIAFGYQGAIKNVRLRFAAFPSMNPALIVLTGPTTVTRTGGFGFGLGGQLALGYKLGPMQVFADVRLSWAPLVTNSLRVQTGGLVFGIGIWYEP